MTNQNKSTIKFYQGEQIQNTWWLKRKPYCKFSSIKRFIY